MPARRSQPDPGGQEPYAAEVTIENIRLGDAAISSFTDVTYQVRQGLGTDEPLILVTERVIEESVDVELAAAPHDADGFALSTIAC